MPSLSHLIAPFRRLPFNTLSSELDPLPGPGHLESQHEHRTPQVSDYQVEKRCTTGHNHMERPCPGRTRKIDPALETGRGAGAVPILHVGK
jgi:hypothetical protein